MKRVVLALAASAAMIGVASAQGLIWVSCEGVESGGGGVTQYQYGLMNTSAAPILLMVFDVGTDDPNIANYSGWVTPAGWISFIVPPSHPTSTVKTPHGMVSPGPLQPTAVTIRFIDPTGVGLLLNPGVPTPGLFGFNNVNGSEDVEWLALDTNNAVVGITNWGIPVAGPLGVYTPGPVHAPIPEPTTCSLMVVLLSALGLSRFGIRRCGSGN